jgi:predicted phage baseplate assembly protein
LEKFEILAEWKAQPDLLRSGPDDFHFVVEIDNDGHPHLRFGDGELGRIPAAATEFRAVYRYGNGIAGNVGAGAIRHVTWCLIQPSGILGIRNPFPAQGGIDPEPMAEVKLFAPSAFRKRLQRAVTADDYASLAQTEFPSKVQRAAAYLRWNGSWYEAQVSVDQVGRIEAEPILLGEVESRLYPYLRIGHDLRVASAQLVPLDIKLDICVRPEYLRGHVKAAVLDVFSHRRRRDGGLGFFHPDNLTFGGSIYLSQLVATAMSVPGVESAVVTQLKRYGEQPRTEIRDGVLSLGPLEVPQLENDPSFPEHGRLELTIGGGR